MINDLPKIGFWYSDYEPHFPHPKDHVGEWNPLELALVVEYLKNWVDHIQYKGWSNCRICGKALGSRTVTDGTYAWPDLLGHYLTEHSVRLPEEFIQHVLLKSIHND